MGRKMPFGMYKGVEVGLLAYENPGYLFYMLTEHLMVVERYGFKKDILDALQEAGKINKDGQQTKSKGRIKGIKKKV